MRNEPLNNRRATLRAIKAFIVRNFSRKTWRGRYERTFFHEFYVLPLKAKLTKRELVYFLHVNKAAGTSAIAGIRKYAANSKTHIIVPLPHRYGLASIPRKAKVALFIRNPETRFASGFEHSYRKGFPHYNTNWSKQEIEVFKVFQSFSSLIQSMSSDDQTLRSIALSAWKHVFHLSHPYRHYLATYLFLQKNIDRIVFVGEQENFQSDWARFSAKFFGENQQMEALNVLHATRETNEQVSRAIKEIYPDEFVLYHKLRSLVLPN